MAQKLFGLFKTKSTEQLISAKAAKILKRGQSLHRKGELAPAAAAYRSILELDPHHWESLNGVAAIALQAGELENAVRLYDAVIVRKPGYAEAHYKRANALNGLGRWDAALAGYDEAIALDPGYANAFCNRGTVLERLGRWDEALASYDRAIALNPCDYLAYYNRGSTLKEMERLGEALASYDRAIALKADYAEAYVNRGHVLREFRQYQAAVESYDKAIELKPIYPEAFDSRGLCLLGIGRIEEAVASYDRALELEPNRRYVFGTRRHAQMHICNWDGLAKDLATISEGLMAGRPVAMPFEVFALLESARLHRLSAEIWMREICPPDDSLGPIQARPRGDKIRIGYFSADFRPHPVSLLTAELFETHDRSKFEITAFALGPGANDPIRARLVRAFDRFIEVRDHSDREVASLARRLGIDIAVDLGGFTLHSRPRILALRAAPVQLSYIGYLGTMGAPYMDYLLADATIIPADLQHHYSEKIIYLPSYQVNDSQRRIADHTFTREELGLPSTGFVFSCFNANYKITPSTFAVWMRILNRVQGSRLFLYVDNPQAEQNLAKQAEAQGVDAHRLVFGERISVEYYLARLRTMDLFLDTLPYNAGTTASDALWAGLPVLTCIGEAFASRYAASLLTAIGLPELITTSYAEYEELAVRLASDPGRLAALREKLAKNRSAMPLFDTPRFTRNLELAYTQIYERSLANLPPEHVYPPG